MKILVIHNKYGYVGGEESLVDNVAGLLEEKGHEVIRFFRATEGTQHSLGTKIRGFFSGIYSRSARKAMWQILKDHEPDIALVHNVFPYISPAALEECRLAGTPLVMSVNNYRLICPHGPFLTRGEICERCAGGREYWCVLRNCQESHFRSLGYAIRNAVARRIGYFHKNVTMYTPFTEFQRQKLIAGGYPAERIVPLPNMTRRRDLNGKPHQGDYVGCVGRVSPEKGTAVLVEAARLCPDIPFKSTGNTAGMPELVTRAPANFEFVGFLSPEELEKFYSQSRFIALPTLCYEGFPTVCAETLMLGKAVVASRIGGMPEIVRDGVTGLLAEPGNAKDLAEKVRHLWTQPELAQRMGAAGHEQAAREYSRESYYQRLMAIFEQALTHGPGGPNGTSVRS